MIMANTKDSVEAAAVLDSEMVVASIQEFWELRLLKPFTGSVHWSSVSGVQPEVVMALSA